MVRKYRLYITSKKRLVRLDFAGTITNNSPASLYDSDTEALYMFGKRLLEEARVRKQLRKKNLQWEAAKLDTAPET